MPNVLGTCACISEQNIHAAEQAETGPGMTVGKDFSNHACCQDSNPRLLKDILMGNVFNIQAFEREPIPSCLPPFINTLSRHH